MWLCCQCMHLHGWKRSCKGREGVVHGAVIAGSLNGAEVDFLIHGLDRPDELSVECSSFTSAAACEVVIEDGADIVRSLSTDLLNTVFQKQFTTVTCIPHQCRLAFSRALKVCLDRVIVNPGNLSAWLQLILLPICTLTLFKPRRSAKKKSGNRRHLQIASIKQALATWKDPNGCFTMVNKLLQQPVLIGLKKEDLKKQGAANLMVCRRR